MASAERVVAAARAGGDPRREAAALTDLGILTGQTDPTRAAAAFVEAMAAAARVGDAGLTSDVESHYGLFLAGAGRAAEGVAVAERAVGVTRAAGDRFAEKGALERLAMAALAAGDPERGLDAYARALALARELGDARHEAELYWMTAIVLAELGAVERAARAADAAVRLFRRLDHPEADRLAEHLDRYVRGGAPLTGTVTFVGGAGFGGAAPAAPAAADPGVLKMAWSALKAAARFVGTGMRTVSPETRRVRLATCDACEYHTGTRCRVCGCFTAVKAHLTHETCPAEKWPT